MRTFFSYCFCPTAQLKRYPVSYFKIFTCTYVYAKIIHTNTHTHTRTHTHIYNIYNTCGKKVVIDRLLSRVISTGDSVNFGPLFCLIVDESRNESLLTKNRLTFAISIECVFQFQQQLQIQLYDNSWDRSLKINGMHGAIHFEYNCAGANMTI